ncbi:MAG: hypothetical protein IPJ41_01650 [Phycisphaerales bacterium]|nr:hypothetical protein [Phycisphaerales bacterium]
MKPRTAALLAALALSAPAFADEFVVTLEGTSFKYNGQTNSNINLVINPGDTVRWVWVSGMHNVVSGNHGDADEGQEFLSGDPVVPPNEYVHAFADAGDFPYHCELHHFLGMVSTVKVRCPSDFNQDLTVNTQDVLAFLNAWTAKDPRADFNHDGTVNTQDVLAFLNAWSSGC